jgi:predicted RNase H-like HicB family nuclease
MLKIVDQRESYFPNIEQELLADGRTVYFASHSELLGVDASGDTPEEAIAAFNDNLKFYLQHLASIGKPMPVPTEISVDLVFTPGKPEPPHIAASVVKETPASAPTAVMV